MSFVSSLGRLLKSLYFKVVITIIVLAIVFFSVDFRAFFELFKKIELLLLPMLIINIFIFWFMNILSLFVLVRAAGKIDFLAFSKDQILSLVIGSVTPGQLGESSIILFLSNNKIRPAFGTAVFLLNKFINLLIIMLFGIFALFYFNIKPVYFIIVFAVFVFLLVLVFYSKTRFFVRDRIVLRLFKKHYDFFKVNYDFFRVHRKALLINILLNFLKVILSGVSIFLVFSLFGLDGSFFTLLSVFSFNRIIALIPITIAGLGILEGGVSLALSQIGYNYDAVLVTMFFLRVVNYLIMGLIALFMLCLKPGYIHKPN